MINPFLTQLKNELKREFPELGDRIYNNWPAPEVKEKYPYMVVFSDRGKLENLQHRKIKEFPDKSILYSTGYYKLAVDLNYLASEGELDNQLELVDKMREFFDIDLRLNTQKESEVSRDFSYLISSDNKPVRDYTAIANARFNGFELDQTGPDLQSGDRRAIFHLSCYVPTFKITEPGVWTSVKLEPVDISERQKITRT